MIPWLRARVSKGRGERGGRGFPAVPKPEPFGCGFQGPIISLPRTLISFSYGGRSP